MQTALNKLRPFAYAASERSGWIAESDDYAIPAERAVSSSCDQWKGCLRTVFRLRTWPSRYGCMPICNSINDRHPFPWTAFRYWRRWSWHRFVGLPEAFSTCDSHIHLCGLRRATLQGMERAKRQRETPIIVSPAETMISGRADAAMHLRQGDVAVRA
jgi:hypothetical protein